MTAILQRLLSLGDDPPNLSARSVPELPDPELPRSRTRAMRGLVKDANMLGIKDPCPPVREMRARPSWGS